MSLRKDLIDRVKQSGDLSPAQWQLVSDVLFLAACEASRWSHLTDDAMLIPDMLSEASEHMQKQAARAAGGGEES